MNKIESAIAYFEIRLRIAERNGYTSQCDIKTALAALRKSEPRQLTLSELREMDGTPVWMNKRKEWVFISTVVETPYAQVWYYDKSGRARTVLYDHDEFYTGEPEVSE